MTSEGELRARIDFDLNTQDSPKLPISGVRGRYAAAAMCGIVISLTAAAVPFMVVPWLPRRVFGALPWLPTSARRVNKALDALPASFTQPGRRFVDLGSGDGVAVFAAAQKGMLAQGVELNPTLVLLSRILAWRRGVKVNFILGNMFDHSIAGVDVIMVYGVVPLMSRIGDKILNECHGPTYVISHKFALASEPWDQYYVQTVDGIRIYFKPAADGCTQMQ
jgi:hypothetical protein